MTRAFHNLLLLLLALSTALLAGCGAAPVAETSPSASAAPSASATASASAAPSGSVAASASAAASVAATATSAPTSTLVPTAAPSPTATASATATSAATATTAPTATAEPAATATAAPSTPAGAGRIAFVRGGGIFAFDLTSRAVTPLVENGRDMQFSPDGTQLAFVRDDGLYLAASDGTGERQIAAATNVRAPIWTDDGTRLAFERRGANAPVGQGEVWTVDLPDGTPLKIADGADPAWAPDGKRIAYVTAPADQGGLQRNQLRLTNWLGQNGWGVVRQPAANTPPTGIPGGELQPAELGHLLFAPAWDAAGQSIYVPALATMQVETDFTVIERADAVNGGATYLATLYDVRDTVAAPDRSAMILVTSSARGDISLETRAIEPGLSDGQLGWAKASSAQNGPTYLYQAPSWSPGSDAIAAIRCEIDGTGQRCDLVRLAPELDAPEVLVPDLFGAAPVDFRVPLYTAWGR